MRSIIFISLLLLTCFQSAMAYEPLLPSHRIVGYYGNFDSPHMGILGEYPPEQVLERLEQEVRKWSIADPNTPVIPAIEYIAVVAQNHPGADEKYRARMPDSQIQKALSLAEEVNGLAILDIQPGLSNVQTEIAHLESYLTLPNVMLAVDPEFAMTDDTPPGKKIGSLDARDINYVIDYMADIVRKHNLPPKILVVHRFTEYMVTHYQDIRPVPEVQVVMDMDGWGSRARKLNTYKNFIAPELVQFTGIKLFYKEDLKDHDSKLFTPREILKFKPVPVFILYQ